MIEMLIAVGEVLGDLAALFFGQYLVEAIVSLGVECRDIGHGISQVARGGLRGAVAARAAAASDAGGQWREGRVRVRESVRARSTSRTPQPRTRCFASSQGVKSNTHGAQS